VCGARADRLFHPSWFVQPVRDLLAECGASPAIGDDKRRPLPEAKPVGPLAYLRLHYGRRGRDGNYSPSELDEWRRRIAAWRARRPAFVYLNNDWDGFAPRGPLILDRGCGYRCTGRREMTNSNGGVKLMIESIARIWLPVTDMERAVSFYRDNLGLEVVEHDGDWSEVTAGDQVIGLNANESPAGDGGAVIAFKVDDIESSVTKLGDGGVEFADEISEHPWGRIAPFKDPDGNDLQLYAPPAD
jgi:predicted enzyme related to lactoylglutathione lyase